MAKDKRESDDRHVKGKSFEEKTGEIFKLKGFEVEIDTQIAGYQVDILIKKRKSIGKQYEYYVCECKNLVSNVDQDVVTKSHSVRDAARTAFKTTNCEAIIVSNSGFSSRAKLTAENHGIELYTYDELLSELMDFDSYLSTLIQNFESSPLNDLYIEQDLFPERNPKEINSFEFVEKWLENSSMKQFSLLGDYGTGKTSFAKKLACTKARQYKKEPGKTRIPFLVDLRKCQKALSLQNLIHQQLVNADIEPANEEIFLKLLSEGKILLIFDAFDEMATMSNADITLANFRELNRSVTGDAKVILTSRTHYFRDKYEVDTILKEQGVKGLSQKATALYREIQDKPEYEIVYLKEFSPAQIKDYLHRAMGEGCTAAYRKIKSIYNLFDLSSRPVLLDIIVKSLPKIEKGEEEFNVVHLYEVYTYSWFDREDHRLQITKEGKEELVETLAYKLWREGKESIHYEELYNVLSEHLKLKIKNRQELEIADYEVRTASFLVRDGEGNYSFAHKSFQEFFIARKIKKELAGNNEKILDLKRLSIEIIFFLRHLVEDDDVLIRTAASLLEGEYCENISENALLLFYTVLKMGFLKQRFSLNEDVAFDGDETGAFRDRLATYLPDEMNLRGALLSGLTMPGTVFKGADFTEAAVGRSVFTHARFEAVVFSRSDMKRIDFSGSVFKDVRFEKVEGHGCVFRRCVFENCTFLESDFSMSNFMDTVFKNCTVESNDFTGAGFLRSNIDMAGLKKKNNRLFGPGHPNKKTSELSLSLNLGHSFNVSVVAVSSDNRFIVSGSDDSTVKLWDVESGGLIKTFEGHKGGVKSVVLTANKAGNSRIVSGSDDHTVKLWDVKSGGLIKTFEGHKGRVNSVVLSADKEGNSRIVSGSDDHTVKLWDVKSGGPIKTFEGHENAVNSVVVSADKAGNSRIVSAGSDHTVKLWDVKSGGLIKTFEGHKGRVNSVVLSADKAGNSRIVSGSDDHTVKLWDVKSGNLIKTFEGHIGRVNSVVLSADKEGNSRMISGSDDNTMKLWDVESGGLIKTYEGHRNWVTSVVVSAYKAGNSRIASGSFDQTVKLWDVKSGGLIKTFEGHKGRVTSVVVSADKADNSRIVSGSDDHTVKLWDVKSGGLIKTFEGHESAVNSVVLSADKAGNSRIVSAGSDNTVKLWDVKSGDLIKTFEGHEFAVNSVVLSADKAGNSRIVSGSSDKTVKLWNVKSGGLIKTFEGHKGRVNSVVLNAAKAGNGWIVSGSNDHTVKLWDVESGNLIKTFEGHTDWVESVFISPDSRTIVSAGWDNTIKLWDIETGRLIYSITLLPGNNAVTLFADNTFFADDSALPWIFYQDGLALYPAEDLKELRRTREEKTKDERTKDEGR